MSSQDNNEIRNYPVLPSETEDFRQILQLINKLGLKLEYIFETHVHADHITAASKLREKTGAKICYGSNSGVKGADIFFDDSEKFKLGNHEIIIHHTPGHTLGCVSYYVDGYIFTGDTLFIEGTGRTDFQGGSSSNTYDSVREKIFSYSNDTIVFPAHNYDGFLMSTIGHERKFNPNVFGYVYLLSFTPSNLVLLPGTKFSENPLASSL